MTEIFQTKLKEAECEEKESKEQQTEEETNKGVKRKFDPNESSDDAQKEKEPIPKDKKMKKAKNVGFLFFPFSLVNVTLHHYKSWRLRSLQFPWLIKQLHLQENWNRYNQIYALCKRNAHRSRKRTGGSEMDSMKELDQRKMIW